MNVLALDLSLTATGIAHCDGTVDTWRTTATGHERLAILRDRITALLWADIDVVAIEGYAYGRVNKMADIGEWGGVARLALRDAGQTYVVIPPSNLKQYATGKGNASKAEVLVAAVTRLGYQGHDDNQADALWLRQMTLDAYGHAGLAMPQTHRGALDKLTWPDLKAAA